MDQYLNGPDLSDNQMVCYSDHHLNSRQKMCYSNGDPNNETAVIEIPVVTLQSHLD